MPFLCVHQSLWHKFCDRQQPSSPELPAPLFFEGTCVCPHSSDHLIDAWWAWAHTPFVDEHGGHSIRRHDQPFLVLCYNLLIQQSLHQETIHPHSPRVGQRLQCRYNRRCSRELVTPCLKHGDRHLPWRCKSPPYPLSLPLLHPHDGPSRLVSENHNEHGLCLDLIGGVPHPVCV